MDYSDLHETIVRMAEAQGVNKSFIEKPETLYYDESGNVKHLIVKGGGLNADSSLVFVLGGIQAESTISLDDLKKHLGKTSINELKANRDLKGDFYSILRKENFRLILQLLVDKNWHIHFFANQILYYGFVDIVDSINGLEPDPFEFKALLYEVLKTNPNATIDHFKKYKYPNIKNGEKAQENNKYVTKQSKENETSNGEICNKTSENLLSQVKNLESTNKEIKNNYDYDIENIEKIKAYK